MVNKKVLIAIIILFLILFIPSISKATDYVVCLDAGHSNNDNYEEDINWFEEMNGDTWDYSKFGNKPDYDNQVNGIITTTEGTLTKKTVMYMVEYLKQYDNIKVVISPRTGEGYRSQRPFYGRDKKANVHISMHYNAANGKAKGTLTEYKPRR